MIIDTNALTAWADGDESLMAVLPDSGDLVLPIIAIGEYKQGLLRSRYRNDLEDWLDQILLAVRLGTISLTTADLYAEVQVQVRERGQPIPTNDAWIAALAIEHGLPVLSRDAHFDVVEGVQRIGW